MEFILQHTTAFPFHKHEYASSFLWNYIPSKGRIIVEVPLQSGVKDEDSLCSRRFLLASYQYLISQGLNQEDGKNGRNLST